MDGLCFEGFSFWASQNGRLLIEMGALLNLQGFLLQTIEDQFHSL
jgi:hypothetical protein